MKKELMAEEKSVVKKQDGGILDNKLTKTIAVILLIVIAFFSITQLSKVMSAPETYEEIIASLDEKKETIMGISTTTTVTALGLSAIPGDITTPVANKLVDLTTYFVIILGAIIMEKYLLTILGYFFCIVVVPVVCALLIGYIFSKLDFLWMYAAKILIAGLLLLAVIPVSINVSDMIQSTYDMSIEANLKSAEEITKETNKNESKDNSEKKKGLAGLWNSVTEWTSDTVSDIKNGTSNITEKAKNILNNFIEMIAVLIVVNCVIPIVIIFIFLKIIKVIFGININPKEKAKEIKNKIRFNNKSEEIA